LEEPVGREIEPADAEAASRPMAEEDVINARLGVLLQARRDESL
jgi:hypothetical protein